MLLSLSFAVAGPIFGTAGSPIQLDPGGNWPRMFPIEGTEKLGLMTASGGNYRFQETDLGMEPVPGTNRDLSSNGDELDHGLTTCPDGTYVHVATATHSNSDDSVYVQKLDANFNVLFETQSVESDPEVTFLDPAAACTTWIWGFAGMVLDNPRVMMRFYTLDADGNVTAIKAMDAGPDAAGSSYYGDEDGLWSVGTRFEEPDYMWLAHFSTRLVGDDPMKIDVAPDGYTMYWYQRLIKVNDVFIVAHMGNLTSEKFDTQTGNVWLTAFDPDWNVIDQVVVTDIAPPLGAFHPWVAQREDQLVVNYTYQGSNYGLYVPVDLEAADYSSEDTGDTGDTGTVDTGDSGDTGSDTDSGDTDSATDTGTDSAADPGAGDTDENPDDGGCGCSTTGSAGFALGLAAAALVTRRRR